MASRLACRDCHYVLDADDGEQCPVCGSNSLTEDWAGYVVIAHIDESDIARLMNVSKPGRYALKVR